MDQELEGLARIAVDCGFKLHETLGPGLLESVYEVCLEQSLARRGLHVERQRPVSFSYEGLILDGGFRVDLLVEERLLIEVKSTERFAPLGLLMNFGAYTFRDGCRRIANNYFGRID